MGKYFGTDGMRGLVGVELCAHHAFKIGRFLGKRLSLKNGGRVVIGKDTRHSSYMLEYATAAGLCSTGANVYLLHVCPTACVSYITKNEGFDFGIMISASHNPYFDNGIKILNSEGEKLNDELILEIENYLDSKEENKDAQGENIGKIYDFSVGREKYLEYLKKCSQAPLFGLKIGIDTASGSAFAIAPKLFSALGAAVFQIDNEPNGTNINEDCGSTHPEALCKFVKENALDLGFAYDGDSDRCIAIDERGKVFDGDKIMYALACNLKKEDSLNKNTLVTTIMSNIGLKNALLKDGIYIKETPVGDRHVFEEMKRGGYSLGGEQSGHIIISKYAKTGDGILTSIKLAELVAIGASPLSSLASDLRLYPQVLKNVRVKNKAVVLNSNELNSKLEELKISLDGRVLVRPSGTEPIIRILVEGKDAGECKKIAKALESIILKEDKI